VRDLLIAVHAWCFADGAYREEPARAMVNGYQQVRRLHRSERQALFAEGMSAALRFCVSRIIDFEVSTEGERAFLDYRDFTARIEAMEALGARGWRRLLGVA
jgi:homoserine kinase type II